jgi:hypothetical protein
VLGDHEAGTMSMDGSVRSSSRRWLRIVAGVAVLAAVAAVAVLLAGGGSFPGRPGSDCRDPSERDRFSS